MYKTMNIDKKYFDTVYQSVMDDLNEKLPGRKPLRIETTKAMYAEWAAFKCCMEMNRLKRTLEEEQRAETNEKPCLN